MFEQFQKKPLLIVASESTIKYAQFLVQLIGTKNEIEDEMQVLDSKISAAVWTEKQYNDSIAKLSSDTYVLFMGKTKASEEQCVGIVTKYNKFGMEYGWLGKRAVLYAEPISFASYKEGNEAYKSFISYVNTYSNSYKYKKMEAPALLKTPLVLKFLLMPMLPISFKGMHDQIKIENKVLEQQYKFLTHYFYLNGLLAFMEA